jgi:hypothetical protein
MVITEESPHLQAVIRELSRLSQAERLQLIAYLAQQAHQAVTQSEYGAQTWQEVAGAAPNLLEGQDAQEWVDTLRLVEWERDLN